jgi:release factor glutamine methyltransferase
MTSRGSTTDVRSLLKQGITQLRNAQVPSFTLAAELLLLHVLNRDRAWIYAHPEEEISPADANRFFALIARRCSGEPTQHLTGKQEFWGLDFEVSPDVLIPRPETEHLIEVALDRLAVREVHARRPQKNSGEGLFIADIGTGSGCIAIALANELPNAIIYATDISPAALAVAKRNAARHGFQNRVAFAECNLLDAMFVRYVIPEGHEPTTIYRSPVTNHDSPFFDLIVSNPPYVSRREAHTLTREVRDHEPPSALFGGEEGYEFYAELIAQSAQQLKSGGILVLELGYNSLPAVQPLLDAANWTAVGVTADLAGIPRVIATQRL